MKIRLRGVSLFIGLFWTLGVTAETGPLSSLQEWSKDPQAFFTKVPEKAIDMEFSLESRRAIFKNGISERIATSVKNSSGGSRNLLIF